MAEEFTLQQLIGQGTAVDRDERLALARRQPVQCAGDQFLAGAAIAGSTSSTRRMAGLIATRSPICTSLRMALRRASSWRRSRKVSTPPTSWPSGPCSRLVDTLTGRRLPSASTISIRRQWMASPRSMVSRRAQCPSHTEARKTARQGWPMASERGIPVMVSAARLNEVMRHCALTVNTPSVIASRIAA